MGYSYGIGRSNHSTVVQLESGCTNEELGNTVKAALEVSEIDDIRELDETPFWAQASGIKVFIVLKNGINVLL